MVAGVTEKVFHEELKEVPVNRCAAWGRTVLDCASVTRKNPAELARLVRGLFLASTCALPILQSYPVLEEYVGSAYPLCEKIAKTGSVVAENIIGKLLPFGEIIEAVQFFAAANNIRIKETKIHRLAMYSFLAVTGGCVILQLNKFAFINTASLAGRISIAVPLLSPIFERSLLFYVRSLIAIGGVALLATKTVKEYREANNHEKKVQASLNALNYGGVGLSNGLWAVGVPVTYAPLAAFASISYLSGYVSFLHRHLNKKALAAKGGE